MWRPDLPLWFLVPLGLGAALLPAILAGLFAWWATGRFLKEPPGPGGLS
jgi:hypothetical protein